VCARACASVHVCVARALAYDCEDVNVMVHGDAHNVKAWYLQFFRMLEHFPSILVSYIISYIGQSAYRRAVRLQSQSCAFKGTIRYLGDWGLRGDPKDWVRHRGTDLVVHAAGPFQRRAHNWVLDAALEEGTAYMDVADDSTWAQRAKQLSEQAARAGVPAITSAGIYPGTSNVMAAHMVSIARWVALEYSGTWWGAPEQLPA
jgi:hypothetical protein